MPRSESESNPTNRDMILEILHILSSLRTEISTLKIDVAHLKQKCLESEQSRKSWIWGINNSWHRCPKFPSTMGSLYG